MLTRAIPFIFVVLWASGFVGARFGLQYAEPATLLSLRMIANVALFVVLIVLLRRRIPTGMSLVHCGVVGMLIHGCYLGGTYLAIGLGMPAGLSSLLVGLQPILTTLILVVTIKQRFSVAQWLGLFLGFIGISLVLAGKVDWQDESHKSLAVGICILALFGITLGTLYQKRFCQGIDMVGSATVQYFAAGMLFVPYAVTFETMHVNWTLEFTLTLVWLVVVLSCIAILLLLYMVEKGASESVASVFYLVPPMTAFQAWLMFDESFDIVGVIGMCCAVIAVYLVVKAPDIRLGRLNRWRERSPN